VRPASGYTARQTIEGVTIGVELFQGKDKIKSAFPKTDLEKVGVVPVLVVISNDNDYPIHLDRMRIELITSDRQEMDPTPVEEVLLPARVKPPSLSPRPSPIPIPGRGSRRPPKTNEIEERAFVAPVVEARSGANGFFYFRLGKGPDRLRGAKLFAGGLRNARTGQEILYFEIELRP